MATEHLRIEDADAFRRDVEASPEPTIVMFTTSWCPFCRRFKPMWDACVEDRPFRFATVYIDGYENPLWDDYQVEAVPSLAVFESGKITMRRDGVLGRGLGQRDMDAICNYARDRFGPA